MPKRDPETGRFVKSADTAKSTDAGSDTGKDAVGIHTDSATGKDAVEIQHTRRRVRGRLVVRRVSIHED